MTQGSAPSLFVGTAAFEILVKQQIKRLEEPSLKCCTMIYDELVRILNSLLQKPVFKRFPALREKFYGVVIRYFQKCMTPTQKLCSDIIAAEQTYINTGHPEFITGHRAMAVVVDRVNAKNNPPPIMDQLQGKDNKRPPAPPPANLAAALPQRDPNADLINQSNQGFFGSFFKNKPAKPGMMEQVPSVLKASGNLSEREQIETEVISNFILFRIVAHVLL